MQNVVDNIRLRNSWLRIEGSWAAFHVPVLPSRFPPVIYPPVIVCLCFFIFLFNNLSCVLYLLFYHNPSSVIRQPKPATRSLVLSSVSKYEVIAKLRPRTAEQHGGHSWHRITVCFLPFHICSNSIFAVEQHCETWPFIPTLSFIDRLLLHTYVLVSEHSQKAIMVEGLPLHCHSQAFDSPLFVVLSCCLQLPAQRSTAR